MFEEKNKSIKKDLNKERKVRNRKQKEATRGKHYYANAHDFRKENYPLPAEFTDKIICGDSQVVLKQLPDNCIDLIFTSPPYNFGLDYEDTEDTFAWDSYFKALFGIFDECIRVLKYGGRIIVNVQPLFSDYIPTHHIISQYFMRKKLIWKGEILWEKKPLQLQVYGLGELEKSIKSLPQIYVGIFGNLLQRCFKKIGRPKER